MAKCDPEEVVEEFKCEPDCTPTNCLTEDEWYSVDDHVDAYEHSTNSWYPSKIVRIEQGDNCQNWYYVAFNKSSIGLFERKCLNHIRPQSERVLQLLDIEPTMRVLAAVEHGLWRVAVVDRIVKSKQGRLNKIWLSVVSDGQIEQQMVKYKTGNILQLLQNVKRRSRDDNLQRIVQNGTKTIRELDLALFELLILK